MFPSPAKLSTTPTPTLRQLTALPPNVAEFDDQRLRDYAKDKAIDKLNAERTDGLVNYGSTYIRNGKPFFINDSSGSPFRDFNRERILDLFDAMNRDPETRHLAYPRVFISDDGGGDYYHPGQLQEIADIPDSIYWSKAKSPFPHVHFELRDGLLYPEAVLHEFGHFRDIALRGWRFLSHGITTEEKANYILHREDQAADHAFRINWFLHPKYRLPDDCLIEDRTHVLRYYSRVNPENSYVEQLVRSPDEIDGRWRYVSLREPGGSADWLNRLLPRPTLRLLTKPAVPKSPFRRWAAGGSYSANLTLR
jgi:hypothetical protein